MLKSFAYWRFWLRGGAIALISTWFITAAAAQAYSFHMGVFLTRRPGANYATFLEQAEAIAGTRIQRAFLEDPLITQVIMTVVENNQGLAMPLMEIQVTRAEWQQTPIPHLFAKYYNVPPAVLGL